MSYVRTSDPDGHRVLQLHAPAAHPQNSRGRGTVLLAFTRLPAESAATSCLPPAPTTIAFERLSSAMFELFNSPLLDHYPGTNPQWQLRAYYESNGSHLPDIDITSEPARNGDYRTWYSLMSEHGELSEIIKVMGSNIRELHQAGDAARVTQDVLRHRFGAWKSVQRLRVLGVELASSVASELSNGPRSERGVLFPQLLSLRLEDSLVAEQATSDEHDGRSSMHVPLLNMLRKRSKVGVPLHVLEVPDLETLKEAWWKELAELADVRSLSFQITT